MKINHALNLVVQTESDDGATVYVHSTPLSKDIFREHFLILGRLYGEFFSSGLGLLASARTAYLLLEKLAKDAGQWEGKDGVQNTLVTHIINGATALYAEEGKGWKSLPMAEAVNRGVVDLCEVMDELVFFTCVCGMTKRNQMIEIVQGTAAVWGALATSLSYMDYMNFLTTSQKDVTTEPKLEAADTASNGPMESSIPS